MKTTNILLLLLIIFFTLTRIDAQQIDFDCCRLDHEIAEELETNCFLSIPVSIALTPSVYNQSTYQALTTSVDITDYSQKLIILNNEVLSVYDVLENYGLIMFTVAKFRAIITDDDSECELGAIGYALSYKDEIQDNDYLFLIHLLINENDPTKGVLYFKTQTNLEGMSIFDCRYESDTIPPINDTTSTLTECVEEQINIVSRSAWGARSPIINDPNRSYETIDTNLQDFYTSIVVHHSGNSQSYPTIRWVQNEHIDQQERADIGYHFAIDSSGIIYEGRDIHILGSHVNQANTSRIGVVLLGDFDDENEGLNVFQRMFENSEDDITSSMDDSFVKLCEYLICEYNIEILDGHNNVPNNTARFCPGRKVLERIPGWRMQLGL